MSYTYTTTFAGVLAIIPLGGGAVIYDGAYGRLCPFGLGNVQFTASVKCRMKVSNGDCTAYALAKIVKTGPD
jgi:hypothetical protein